MKILEVSGVKKYFGNIPAVDNLTFTAFEGQIKAIIGPNGAGKTTLFNIISGLIKQDAGRIHFKGREISNLRPYQRARLGIGRTFQKAFVFENMSVYENVLVIAENVKKDHREKRSVKEIASEALIKVGLSDKAHLNAGVLSAGERHLLEIARALAIEPALLLLDEPAAGLNDAETEFLREILFRLKSEGICILLVEHDMHFVMDTADEVLAIHYGKKLAEGPPMLIQEDKQVIEAYLGSDIHHD